MYGKTGYLHIIPAPSMAEVWRELPESGELSVLIEQYMDETYEFGNRWGETDVMYLLRNINKLIDLLVWVTEQEKEVRNEV